MVQAGDMIENPVTGERITFLRTSAETGGALAELELAISAQAFLPAAHVHRVQDERFEVLEGRIRLRCRDEESVREPGDIVLVPAGSPHSWAPTGGRGARVKVTFTPGRDIELFFDDYFRLAREGRTGRNGLPRLVDSARLGSAHEMYLAGPPLPLQRAAFRVLLAASRRRPDGRGLPDTRPG